MVTMPAGPKNEVWNLVLVRVPRAQLAACAAALAEFAGPLQYAGGGWYIKRIEAIEPKVAGLANAYSLSIAVKAGTQKTMDGVALPAIAKTLQESSGGTAQYDVYVVNGIQYMANW